MQKSLCEQGSSMIDLLNTLVAKEPIFWFCALAGSGMFIIQFLLTLLGADNSEDADSGNFKWLSKQGLTGFLMMFGWVGLTCRKEFELSGAVSIAIAFGGGILALVATAFLFNGAKKLRSSGTVFKIEDTIGKEATVYQRISKGGMGKISVSLHSLTYEIDAISHHPEDLLSFTPVQIIKKADENTVVVVPSK